MKPTFSDGYSRVEMILDRISAVIMISFTTGLFIIIIESLISGGMN